MKLNKLIFLFSVAYWASLSIACSSETRIQQLPVVDGENCKNENILKIKDKTAREKFASKCARRGTFRKSTMYAW